MGIVKDLHAYLVSQFINYGGRRPVPDDECKEQVDHIFKNILRLTGDEIAEMDERGGTLRVQYKGSPQMTSATGKHICSCVPKGTPPGSEERTCPSGHKLPAREFQSHIDLTKDVPDQAIIFECPGGKRGHQFTLTKAIASGMFTEEEAAGIRTAAEKTKAEWAVR